jgi:hypothetical protein
MNDCKVVVHDDSRVGEDIEQWKVEIRQRASVPNLLKFTRLHALDIRFDQERTLTTILEFACKVWSSQHPMSVKGSATPIGIENRLENSHIRLENFLARLGEREVREKNVHECFHLDHGETHPDA